MTLDYPIETNPGRPGAPLPKGIQLRQPRQAEVLAEIARCEVELMYAIARHRKAWSMMEKWARHREQAANQPGGLAAMESDPVWKKRTGDVTWWRGEMEARASTLLALNAMSAL